MGWGHVTRPDDDAPLEVLPVVVLSKKFPARPSSIPEIRDFVRRCLAESPLSEADNIAVSQTVFRALLDAAGPTGTIQLSFRLFPEHVEVDVLHSDPNMQEEPTLGALAGVLRQEPQEPRESPVEQEPQVMRHVVADNFADWMSGVLRRKGLTQEQAARQLGVSVKTVSRWVGGETEPRFRDLRRIQEEFGDTPLS
jgi:hypothetical protein